MELTNAIFNRLLAKASFRHIQAVVLIAEHGSTHKAAEWAGTGQPSIIKFLNVVEALVQGPLFERHARGMRATAICLALLPSFQALLKTLKNGAQAMHDVQSGAAGTLHLGALPAACRVDMMCGIAQFMESYPQYRLHLEESTLSLLTEYLEGGIYDAVLVRSPASLHAGYQFDPLHSDHSVVLARCGHRLANKRALRLETLAQESWLELPIGTTSRLIFESWFTSQSIFPKVMSMTTDSLPALTTFVAQSDALLVVPYSFALPALANGEVCALDVTRRDDLPALGILWHPASASVAATTFCGWMTKKQWRGRIRKGGHTANVIHKVAEQ